jgi:hypothetical protein
MILARTSTDGIAALSGWSAIRKFGCLGGGWWGVKRRTWVAWCGAAESRSSNVQSK